MTNAGGVVLCGGRSSRMRRPKAWLPIGGEFMLQRVVRVVASVVNPVVVVAAPGQDVPPLPGNVEVVRDEVEGQGPMGGLAAGLAALRGNADVAYLSGCDVPLLNEGFVRRVVDLASRDREGAGTGEWGQWPPLSTAPAPSRSRLAVPFIAGYFHPLAAAYRTDLLPVVRSLVAAGRLRMTDLFDLVPTCRLVAADFTDVDPHLQSLTNVNTPAEYDRVQQIIAGRRT